MSDDDVVVLWHERVLELEDAVRRIYMWVSPPAFEDEDILALVEARRICREVLGVN